MDSIKPKSNLEINEKENCCFVLVNPKLYPLDVVYSAAYIFLDRAYILLNGDPRKEIVVELKPKEKYDLEKLGREFNNELLNYADYKNRSISAKSIREAIVQRALITNAGVLIDTIKNDKKSYSKDPDRIAVPWEEKYGEKDTEIVKKRKKGGKK